ncbi:MAG: hypothetical protein ABIO85_01090 [Sphingomicrobium sp.]
MSEVTSRPNLIAGLVLIAISLGLWVALKDPVVFLFVIMPLFSILPTDLLLKFPEIVMATSALLGVWQLHRAFRTSKKFL